MFAPCAEEAGVDLQAADHRLDRGEGVSEADGKAGPEQEHRGHTGQPEPSIQHRGAAWLVQGIVHREGVSNMPRPRFNNNESKLWLGHIVTEH